MPRGQSLPPREQLGEAFARDLWKSWKEHGPAAIEAVRTDKPDLYVKLVTTMLPKEMTVKPGEIEALDDAALDRRIAALARGLGLALELVQALEAKSRRKATDRLVDYRPYAKQIEFHRAGALARERLLMAGNQLGKTYCGAAEAAIHLTGLYPDWWAGRRFDRPVRAWVGSKTGEVTRDGAQRLLVGEPRDRSQYGQGMIPARRLIAWSAKGSTPGAVDGLTVRHASGGVSTLGFKSFDQGREKWQGETLDFVWFDEEPPLDVYIEGLTRTNATGGMAYLTFTPLLGMSEVVGLFLADAAEEGRNRTP